METNIVADGSLRYGATGEHQARCRELQRAVTAKYAAELERAGFFRRILIRHRRYREFQQELRKITPSAQSCWYRMFTIRREGPGHGGGSEG